MADCFNVKVVGSWRLVVVSLNHASIQDTSSSFKLSVGFSSGGGSKELQVAKKKVKIKKFNKNSLLVIIT